MLPEYIEFHSIAERLGHLSSVWVEPHAMCNNRPRKFDTCSQQESRPIDCMKSEYIFPDQMKCRPKLFEPYCLFALLITEADRCDVICQSIKPNVHSVRRVVRNRHSPTY